MKEHFDDLLKIASMYGKLNQFPTAAVLAEIGISEIEAADTIARGNVPRKMKQEILDKMGYYAMNQYGPRERPYIVRQAFIGVPHINRLESAFAETDFHPAHFAHQILPAEVFERDRYLLEIHYRIEIAQTKLSALRSRTPPHLIFIQGPPEKIDYNMVRYLDHAVARVGREKSMEAIQNLFELFNNLDKRVTEQTGESSAF